jgi:bla regulator protein BlaR1
VAGRQFTVTVASRDRIDLPFVNDPQIIGRWKSVDFVKDISQFNPAHPAWKGKLYLKGLTFLENGKTAKPWWTWTKGVLIHHGDQTASHYEIQQIKGRAYLFLEWKSGDFTISGRKPSYYVLQSDQ